MIPLSDTQQTGLKPYINYIIITTCFLVFIVSISGDFNEFISKYALNPAKIESIFSKQNLTFISSIFLHGSWGHLLSNMWALYLYGDNVEQSLGHIKYLFFFLLAGFVASLVQYLYSIDSSTLILGASGAISGVMGYYLVTFPNNKIKVLTYGLRTKSVSAVLFIGFWFGYQILAGFSDSFSLGTGGVAWWAHIGGFLFGYIIGRLLKK